MSSIRPFLIASLLCIRLFSANTTTLFSRTTFDYDANARNVDHLTSILHQGDLGGIDFDYVQGKGPVDIVDHNTTSISKEFNTFIYDLDYFVKIDDVYAHSLGLHILDQVGMSYFYTALMSFYENHIDVALTLYSTPVFATKETTDATTNSATTALDLANSTQVAGLFADVRLFGYKVGYVQDTNILQMILGHEWETRIGRWELKARYNDLFSVTSYDVMAFYAYDDEILHISSENTLNSLGNDQFLLEASLGSKDHLGYLAGVSYVQGIDKLGYFLGLAMQHADKDMRFDIKLGYSKDYLPTLELFPMLDQILYRFSFDVTYI